MHFFLLALLAAPPVTVAALAPNVVGVDQSVADAMIERFATQLGADGDLAVSSARDLRNVLGLEQQKSLLGCDEGSSSCMTELAAALGVDVLMTSTVAKIGKSMSITIRALNAKTAAVIAQQTHRDADADALQDWLDSAKPAIANGIRRAAGRSTREAPPEVQASTKANPTTVPWVLAVSGLAVGAGGVALLALSASDALTLKTSSTLTLSDIDSLERAGVIKRWVGVGLFGVAGAALTAALILFVNGAPPSSRVSVHILPVAGGAAGSVGFTW